jgi:hypothetical protein
MGGEPTPPPIKNKFFMGLDMYLTKRIDIGERYNKVTGKLAIEKDGKSIEVNLNKIDTIIESVAYWRKANQIHAWFVENIQNGKDDCREYYVTRKQLKQLLTLCLKVRALIEEEDSVVTHGYKYENGVQMPILVEEGKQITNWDKVAELLPTRAGFFFGSTDYDEGYISDIDNTINRLQDALKDEEGDFYYRSSW